MHMFEKRVKKNGSSKDEQKKKEVRKKGLVGLHTTDTSSGHAHNLSPSTKLMLPLSEGQKQEPISLLSTSPLCDVLGNSHLSSQIYVAPQKYRTKKGDPFTRSSQENPPTSRVSTQNPRTHSVDGHDGSFKVETHQCLDDMRH